MQHQGKNPTKEMKNKARNLPEGTIERQRDGETEEGKKKRKIKRIRLQGTTSDEQIFQRQKHTGCRA